MIRREACLCLIAQASLGFSYFGIYAVLLNLYLLRLGYGLGFISLVNAAGQLSFAVCSLSAGLGSQRYGNRRVMILGMCLNLLGFGLLPLISFKLFTLEAIWLVMTYALAWLGLALVIVNIIPFLMDATGPQERSLVFSMVGAVLSLSGFAGNLVGGLLPPLFAAKLGVPLDSPDPYRYPLLLAAMFLIPGLLALLATRDVQIDHQVQTSPSTVGPVPLGLIIPLALVMLLMRTGEGAARTFFNVYLDAGLGVSIALIAVLAAGGQLLAIPAALTGPGLIARFGLRRTIMLGILGMGCSLVPLALIPHWGAAGLGFLGVMVLVSFTVPAFGIYHQELMPLTWRTVMSGAATMAVGLSWAFITLGGGYIITTLGYRSFFLTGAALTTAGGLLFWAYSRRPQGVLVSSPDLDKIVGN